MKTRAEGEQVITEMDIPKKVDLDELIFSEREEDFEEAMTRLRSVFGDMGEEFMNKVEESAARSRKDYLESLERGSEGEKVKLH